MKTMTKRAAKMAEKKLMKRIGVLNAVRHTHGTTTAERDAADAELKALWAEVFRLNQIIDPNPGPRTDSMFS
jgi:hypothetical protein